MVLKSCSGHIFQFREAAKNKAKDQAITLSKDIIERIRNATIRVYKLWGVENLVIVGSQLICSKDLKDVLDLRSSSLVLEKSLKGR